MRFPMALFFATLFSKIGTNSIFLFNFHQKIHFDLSLIKIITSLKISSILKELHLERMGIVFYPDFTKK